MEDTYLRTNIELFYDPVEMPGGYTFNHVQTLKKIDLYYNSHYEKGDYDSKGRKKGFYNIVKDTCDIASKFTDLDTKDFILEHEMPGTEWKVWIMQHDLKRWMKEQKFGMLLNDVNFDYPKQGSVVLKKGADKKWYIVRVQNLRMNPSVECLEDSPFVYEAHLMNKSEIDAMKPWDKEKVKELYDRGEDEQYLVYECYHQDGDTWKRQFVADLFCTVLDGHITRGVEALINSRATYIPSIVLYEDTLKELPYRELHWEKVPGRWLGRGFVELLFEDQVAVNEAEYLERKGLHHKAMQNWTSRDETIGKNLLTDMEDGDIIKTNAPLLPVVKDNSDLSAFRSTRDRWDSRTRRATFSFDASKGEGQPSGTPLGLAQINVAQITTFFNGKRETAGLFWKDIILEDVIPTFKKEMADEHDIILKSSTAGLDNFVRAIARAEVDRNAFDFIFKTGALPTEAERIQQEEQMVREILSRKGVALTLPESFYEDLKFSLDINVTGEQLDASADQTLLTMLQLLGANPAVLQNPSTRAIVFKILEMKGFSPIDLDLMNQSMNQPQPMLQPGSPMAAPNQSNPLSVAPAQPQ